MRERGVRRGGEETALDHDDVAPGVSGWIPLEVLAVDEAIRSEANERERAPVMGGSVEERPTPAIGRLHGAPKGWLHERKESLKLVSRSDRPYLRRLPAGRDGKNVQGLQRHRMFGHDGVAPVTLMKAFQKSAYGLHDRECPALSSEFAATTKFKRRKDRQKRRHSYGSGHECFRPC